MTLNKHDQPLDDSPSALDDEPLDATLLQSLVALDSAIRLGGSPEDSAIGLTDSQRVAWEAARIGLEALAEASPSSKNLPLTTSNPSAPAFRTDGSA